MIGFLLSIVGLIAVFVIGVAIGICMIVHSLKEAKGEVVETIIGLMSTKEKRRVRDILQKELDEF